MIVDEEEFRSPRGLAWAMRYGYRPRAFYRSIPDLEVHCGGEKRDLTIGERIKRLYDAIGAEMPTERHIARDGDGVDESGTDG